MSLVFFFDGKPTIGYCSHCNAIAAYSESLGLHCPACHTTDLSILEWDGESALPE